MTSSINKTDLLSSAKKYLIEHPTNPLCEATHAQYAKEYLRATKNCRSIDEAIKRICDTRKRSTYFKRKYAVQRILAEKIHALLLKVEGDSNAEESLKQLRTLLSFAAQIAALGPACPIPEGEKLARKSKRQDLRGLPSDWREQLIERMRGSVNYLPGLVLAVSGCRPAELKKGIQITINSNMMVIKISGAKLGEHKGQPERTLEYHLPTKNNLVSKLEQAIQDYSGSAEISINNANSFCSAIQYYGQQVFPSRQRRITPYCFRHAFASDIKRRLGDNDSVSQALGHRVDKTKSSYGQARMGKAGGLAPDQISATHSIKHVRSQLPDPPPAPSL